MRTELASSTKLIIWVKEGLRQDIKDLEDKQNLLNNTHEKNDKWADLVLKSSKKLTGIFVSEEDIKLVKKFEQEILEEYVGFQLPELPDGKFPDFNLDDYQ